MNGSSISVYLDGMTFDTGRGNPGARGLEYHANNVGRLENVVIRSGDGDGVCGLDLTHHDCGPNVRVEGFDCGVQSNHQEYSMTFEHLRLRGQKMAVVFNQGNILALRGLVSENAVIDRLACVHIQHASPATLVLRSSSPVRYSTGAAARPSASLPIPDRHLGGKLFAEDVGGADWHFRSPAARLGAAVESRKPRGRPVHSP